MCMKKIIKKEPPLTDEARHAAGQAQMISYFENQYIGWHYVAIKSIKKIIVNINDFYSDFDFDKSNAEQDLFSPNMVDREIYNGWLYEALSHAEQAIEDLFSLMKCAQSSDWFARDVVVYKAAVINKYIRMFKCDSPEYYLEQLHIPNVEDNEWADETAHAKYKESVEIIRRFISDLVEFYNYYYLDYCQYKHGLSIMLRAGRRDEKTPLKGFIKTYDSWNFVGRHINEKNTPALAIDLFPETAPYLNKLNKENNLGSSWVIVGEKHPQPQHLC